MKAKIVYANPNRYFLDDREVSREEFIRATFTKDQLRLRELFAAGPSYAGVEACRQSKPKLSDALAVHPDQVPEAAEHARRHGVPTDFAPDGRCIVTSRAHQKKLCKLYGFHNRDASYGD